MADCKSTDRHPQDGVSLSQTDRELLLHLLERQDKESGSSSTGPGYRPGSQLSTSLKGKSAPHSGISKSSWNLTARFRLPRIESLDHSVCDIEGDNGEGPPLDLLTDGLFKGGAVHSSILLAELLELLETDAVWSPRNRTPAVNSQHLSAFYSTASDTESLSNDCDHLSVGTTESLDAPEANFPGDSCSYEELEESLQLNLDCKSEIDCEEVGGVHSQTTPVTREGSPSRVPCIDRLTPPHPVDDFLPSDLPSTISPSHPFLYPAKARSWPRSGFRQRLKAPLSEIFKKRHSSNQL
ncbi:uncharacterized protein N7498_009610 [Penicillium cinerascens]|uniref:Uncharacterized protein n=1 Tax=Penicillium cinerascens TaxID=70096 RepID=A0A9W9J5B3_9EURO|nr:uncharacterized protein N7498_009610 [Penicillium cinerascens]KAJ5190625.1 hypothetical protein N7498_009610 [Penicillium cinerascens]